MINRYSEGEMDSILRSQFSTFVYAWKMYPEPMTSFAKKICVTLDKNVVDEIVENLKTALTDSNNLDEVINILTQANSEFNKKELNSLSLQSVIAAIAKDAKHTEEIQKLKAMRISSKSKQNVPLTLSNSMEAFAINLNLMINTIALTHPSAAMLLEKKLDGILRNSNHFEGDTVKNLEEELKKLAPEVEELKQLEATIKAAKNWTEANYSPEESNIINKTYNAFYNRYPQENVTELNSLAQKKEEFYKFNHPKVIEFKDLVSSFKSSLPAKWAKHLEIKVAPQVNATIYDPIIDNNETPQKKLPPKETAIIGLGHTIAQITQELVLGNISNEEAKKRLETGVRIVIHTAEHEQGKKLFGRKKMESWENQGQKDKRKSLSIFADKVLPETKSDLARKLEAFLTENGLTSQKLKM